MATDPRDLRADAPLLDAWLSFQENDIHPFTIPGHKHRHDLVGDVVAGDVPLFAGLDSMKLTRGVLADAERRAARLWGADRAIFSVGGSSHGNQTLALAVGKPGDRIVLSRTAHRSMHLGLVLAGLEPHWLIPEVDASTGLPQPTSAAQVTAALAEAPDAVAAHVTDPAYVGTCADLAAIAAVTEAHGIPLLVDAAWAAHFGFHPALPRHAIAAGADALVTSAHKLLPAWSQGALILARGDRIDADRLAGAAEATATTSPAGAIFASIDAARALVARAGHDLLATAIDAVSILRQRLSQIQGLVVLDGPGVDPLKVTLVLGGTGADGNVVEADLLAAGTPLEMADRDTLVAIVTLADTHADLDRLAGLLEEAIERRRGAARTVVPPAAYAVVPELAMTPRDAFFARREPVPVARAEGRVSAELIAPYPPGIPVLAPGERITAHVLDALVSARCSGIRIAYAADPTLATLRCVG